MALHFLLDVAAGGAPGDAVTLTGAEAHHAAVVRRVRVGEEVTLGDGRGLWASGVVMAAQPKEVRVRIDAVTHTSAPTPRVTLVQALAKGDRDELAVQAATELGVDEIVPWSAARSISHWDAAKAAKGRARWQAIAREAGKQAHRAWLPDVTELASTKQLAARAVGTGSSVGDGRSRSSRMLVLEPTAPTALTALDIDERDILLVVGPEGGIAPEELQLLQDAGADLVRLGDTVLRTSTAGPAALAVVSSRLGRW